MKKEPAFPWLNPKGMVDHPGLTKREWFAGLAMQGMCANHGTYGQGRGPQDVAERAFDVADAMINESEKTTL